MKTSCEKRIKSEVRVREESFSNLIGQRRNPQSNRRRGSAKELISIGLQSATEVFFAE